MTEPQDTFWKWLLSITAGSIVLGAFVIVFFLVRSYPSYPTLPNTIPGDPFAFAQTATPAVVSDTFYKEALPFGASDISWSATVAWQSRTRVFEGAYAARATFNAEWVGAGLTYPAGVPTATYSGISLALYVEPGLSDLYLELYDENEQLVGRQSLGHYHAGGALTAGVWQEITVPLANFGRSAAFIRSVAVVAPSAGVVYLDHIRLVKNAPAHSVWTGIPEVAGAETDTSLIGALGRTQALSLPYTLPLAPESIGLWHVEGQFSISTEALLIGPLLQGGSTHAVFLPGLSWTNYRIDTVVDWATGITFSLVGRIKDEGDFVTCAFSLYGSTVHLYSTVAGKTTLLGETPFLGVPAFEAWSKVPLSMEVVDNEVRCFSRGERVLSATPPGMSSYGTVGLEVWDTNPMQPPHRVRSFSVTPL